MKEIRLAKQLENKYSKNQILEFYVNSIYFGNGIYGVEKAAKLYFDKEVKNLSLGESAMLVGMIKAPSYYNPYTNKEKCEQRKTTVLKLMNNQGYISMQDYKKTAKCSENIKNSNKKSTNNQRHAPRKGRCVFAL